jgi:hypothetical protein
MALGKKKNKNQSYEISDKDAQLLEHIMECYVAAYNMKQQLGLDELWSKCQDYWAGEINLPVEEDDPGSEVNIVQPVIESQVADIVNGDTDILVKGLGPSDQVFARDVTQILKWVWYHNNMTTKLDSSERDRLNLGNVIWKVYWDKDAMSGRGMPTIEPLGPDCFFPDPKVTDVEKLQDADFIIQTSWYSRRKLIQMFGDKARRVSAESNGIAYDPRIFGEADYSGTDAITNDQACLFEFWERKEDGTLRLVYCTKDVILADSDDDDEEASIPDNDKYPFVMIVGYKKKGRLWGMGDTEQLIPVQDVINDLDDQIRMNARLMGNAQTVVGIGAGINIKKWTNKPGLKIPAKDHTAFQTITPPYIPAYINNRREKAFYESELVSGRSEVVEGRRSGSLRAASAILALQEAGSRRGNHKKLMLQTGLKQAMDLVLDNVKEFMTVEQAFDITEKDKIEYLWFRGSDLKAVPQLTLNENFNAESDDPLKGRYKPLYDEPQVDEFGNENPGELLTKVAEFDIELHIGAGMPNNKSFLYEAAVELHRENIVTTEETRATLKQILNWPIIDPWSPEGVFAGRNSSADQLDIANSITGQQPILPPEQQPSPQLMPQEPAVDPAILQQLQAMMASGNVDQNQLYALLSGLPPEILNQVLAGLQGGMA